MRQTLKMGGTENSVTTKDVVVEANRAKEEAKWESQSTTVITQEDITKNKLNHWKTLFSRKQASLVQSTLWVA